MTARFFDVCFAPKTDLFTCPLRVNLDRVSQHRQPAHFRFGPKATELMRRGELSLWVISRHLQCKKPCLLYPQEQTLGGQSKRLLAAC